MAFQFNFHNSKLIEKLKKNCYFDEKTKIISKNEFGNCYISERNVDAEYFYILNRKSANKKYLGLK